MKKLNLDEIDAALSAKAPRADSTAPDLDEIDAALSSRSEDGTSFEASEIVPDTSPTGKIFGMQLHTFDHKGRSAADNIGIGARQLARGATAGLYMPAKAKIESLLGFGDYEDNIAAEREQARLDRQVDSGAEIAGALVGLGKLSPAARLAQGAKGAKGLAKAGAGAVGEGAAYGAASAFSEGEDVGQGALRGGLLGGAGTGVVAAGRKVATPLANRLSGKQTDAAARLEREGIELTAGQKTGSDRLMTLESELAKSSGVDDLAMRQNQQLTRAATRRAGPEESSVVDQSWIERQDQFFQEQYDTIRAANGVTVNPPLRAELNAIEKSYKDLAPTGAQKKVIGELVSGLRKRSGGKISGDRFVNEISDLKKKERTYRSDSVLSGAVREIREVLESAADKQMGPDLMTLKMDTDRQYSAFKQINRGVATGSAGNAAEGILTPQRLNMAARQNMDEKAFNAGKGPLNKLSKDANLLMKRQPDSGTGTREDLNAMLRLGGAGAAGSTAMLINPDASLGLSPGLLGAAVGYTLAKPLLARSIMSRRGQSYLANTRYPGPASDASAQAVMRANRLITTGAKQPEVQGEAMTPEQRALLGRF